MQPLVKKLTALPPRRQQPQPQRPLHGKNTWKSLLSSSHLLNRRLPKRRRPPKGLKISLRSKRNLRKTKHAVRFRKANGRMTEQRRTDPIRICAITVRTGRLVCDVEIPEPRFRFTTPRLAAFVVQQYPDLPHHACVNGKGSSFSAVIECTSTPHLLEHLVISLQTRAATGATDSFVGTTEWLDETAGLARVEASFRDDLEALRAFNEATQILNIAVLTCLA